jgi:hypothetical protein
MIDQKLKSGKLNYICGVCNELVDRTEILDCLNGIHKPDLEPLVISEPT